MKTMLTLTYQAGSPWSLLELLLLFYSGYIHKPMHAQLFAHEMLFYLIIDVPLDRIGDDVATL